MFPYINVHKGDQIWLVVCDQILVIGWSELKSLATLVIYKPSPAWSLDCCCVVAKVLNEIVIRAPSLINMLGQNGSATWSLTATFFNWSKWFPEESMIEIATSIESNILS